MTRLLRLARWAILAVSLGLTGCRPVISPDLTTPAVKPSPTRSEGVERASAATPSQSPTDMLPSPRVTPTAPQVASPTPDPSRQRTEGGALGTI